MSKQRRPISNFAFFVLETTGLPHEENNKTKITQLSISIVESNHLCLGAFPRVRNKLNLCLNPCKPISPKATEITGLSNELLAYQPQFSLDIIKTICNFLNLHGKPICLVARNGNKFHYPILRAEISKLEGKFPEDILCVDSYVCFKDLHRRQELSKLMADLTTKGAIDAPVSETSAQKKSASFKLRDIYEPFTSKTTDNSRNAEADVEYLIHCAAENGQNFIAWANENAMQFEDIPPMRPGKRVGGEWFTPTPHNY